MWDHSRALRHYLTKHKEARASPCAPRKPRGQRDDHGLWQHRTSSHQGRRAWDRLPRRVGALRRGMVCGRQFGVEYQTVGSDVRLVTSDTQHVQQKRGKGLVLGHLGHVREEREKQHANQWWLYHIIPNLRKCSSYSILQRWELSHR